MEFKAVYPVVERRLDANFYDLLRLVIYDKELAKKEILLRKAICMHNSSKDSYIKFKTYKAYCGFPILKKELVERIGSGKTANVITSFIRKVMSWNIEIELVIDALDIRGINRFRMLSYLPEV